MHRLEHLKLIYFSTQERSRSPIAIKLAKAHHVDKEGTVRYMYWMKARDIPHYEAPFQKVGSLGLQLLAMLISSPSAFLLTSLIFTCESSDFSILM